MHYTLLYPKLLDTMKKITVIVLLCSFLTLPVSGQTEEEVDEFIESVLNCTDTPGLSLTIVKEGKVKLMFISRNNI